MTHYIHITAKGQQAQSDLIATRHHYMTVIREAYLEFQIQQGDSEYDAVENGSLATHIQEARQLGNVIAVWIIKLGSYVGMQHYLHIIACRADGVDMDSVEVDVSLLIYVIYEQYFSFHDMSYYFTSLKCCLKWMSLSLYGLFSMVML